MSQSTLSVQRRDVIKLTGAAAAGSAISIPAQAAGETLELTIEASIQGDVDAELVVYQMSSEESSFVTGHSFEISDGSTTHQLTLMEKASVLQFEFGITEGGGQVRISEIILGPYSQQPSDQQYDQGGLDQAAADLPEESAPSSTGISNILVRGFQLTKDTGMVIGGVGALAGATLWGAGNRRVNTDTTKRGRRLTRGGLLLLLASFTVVVLAALLKYFV
jgi:hypothetical protein